MVVLVKLAREKANQLILANITVVYYPDHVTIVDRLQLETRKVKLNIVHLNSYYVRTSGLDISTDLKSS